MPSNSDASIAVAMALDNTAVRRHSMVWKYFIIKDAHNYLATCKGCNNDYSYRTSVTNLTKHWKKSHGDLFADDDADSSEVDEWINNSVKKKHRRDTTNNKSTWQYFDVLDDDKFSATCKLCSKELSYDTVSDLTQHLNDEHDIVVSDCEENTDVKPKINVPRKSRKLKSYLWRYMQNIGNKKALCRLCCKKLSYRTSNSNLKKHLQLSHPEVDLMNNDSDDADMDQKVIITTDGKIYELHSDDEKDPICADVEYLENLDDDDEDGVAHFENIITTTPSKDYTTYEVPKKLPKKETNTIIYQNNSNKNNKERLTVKNNSINTLDIFGQYVTSLLSQLPHHVSDQLQSDIIKQIFAAKVALNTPNIVSSEKPVTITINQVTGTSMPEITVNNDNNQIQETIDVITKM